MFAYRKRQFGQAFSLLDALRADRADLASLKKLQQLLLREIVRTEQKIRELKSNLRAIQETGGKSAAKRSAYLKNRIERYRQGAYVWRCFGDAIAFLYMDKHALKQVYFNLDNARVKNEAGFIIGKEGLINEIAHLEYAIAQQVPALLTDLTDTIRHGDICLMGGPDPVLIEVKAGKKLDRRGRKQKRDLEKLHQFFETDKAENLRGFKGEIRRHELHAPEHTYVTELNECIATARAVRYATRTPEAGLHYFALSEGAPRIDKVMSPFEGKSIWLFNLNELKNTRAWAPYIPFTLTLTSNDNLWSFVRGDVFVLIVLELEQLCIIAKKMGYDASIEREEDGAPSFRFRIPESEGVAGPSSFTLARIGIECVSPEWLVKASIELLKETARHTASG
jgi:hypothetical protein